MELTVVKERKNKQSEEQRERNVVYRTKNLNLWYGEHHALKNIDLDIYENEVTAIIICQVVENRHILKR